MRSGFLSSLALAVLFSTVACTPLHPSAPAQDRGMDGGGMRVFNSQAEAVSYARGRLARGDSAILFRLAGAGPSTVKALAAALTEGASLRSVEVRMLAGVVMIEPRYAEDALLLRAYKEPAVAAGLSPTRKRALAEARKAVDAAMRLASDYECALALHDFIVTRAAYKATPAAKGLDTCVSELLVNGKGICEGYTRTYRLLLDMAGIPNRFVGGSSRGVSHCWNLVQLGGRWFHVDCTYDDPLPDSPGRVLHSYFGLADSQISPGRSWKRGSVPAAPSLAQP